nr:MAG TPA: Stage V sporulation protein S (SpoVS) [Caudoviricetes sp.]
MCKILKASKSSDPHSVAGAIAGTVDENGIAEIQAIGAGALNQAIKAVIIARGFFAPRGIELQVIPSFLDVDVEGNTRTAIRLSVRGSEG